MKITLNVDQTVLRWNHPTVSIFEL